MSETGIIRSGNADDGTIPDRYVAVAFSRADTAGSERRPDKPSRRRRTAPLVDRFWAKVDRSQLSPGGCWPWTGGVNRGGYGNFVLGDKRVVSASRLSCVMHHGPPPGGAESSRRLALHVCDNPPCVNPAHLRWGSHWDNAIDREERGRGVLGRKRAGGQPAVDQTPGPERDTTRGAASSSTLEPASSGTPGPTEDEQSDYLKFRGKCREMSEALCAEDKTLTLMRGHYFDPQWGEQPHWWCQRADGTVVDPTAAQFPSKGGGVYVPFDGFVECSECGKRLKEEDAEFESNYVFCSYTCHGRFVGVF